MATRVEMPKPGNTVEECLIAKWVKAAGARVTAGEVIAEIETDKATFEVPSPADGVLLARFFEEGALVPVYTNIAVVGEPGEDTGPFAPAAAAAPAATPGAAPAERVVVSRLPAQAETGGGTGALSPRARRFAEEHKVAVEGLRGSGPGGRILEQDVRDRYHSAPTPARARAAEPAEAAIPPARAGAAASAAGEPVDGIREKIARRMRESLAQTAQYTLSGSADAAGLLAVRKRVKASQGALPDVNINELVLFCTVKALLKMPQLNAEFRDGRLQRHERVHLGFACDTERGLLVPVVRDAHLLSVAELSAQVKSLAERATSGKISPDDLTGATFTVSNLGSLGIESFTPLLNPPQVGILGVNTIETRAVRSADGVAFADRIGLSLTCDHQVIDGAPGARFLAVVRECIEQVEALSGLGA
jgi:pyruvate dehydrogenase E2 component (dihydrolipoamide acetyltransferase)